MGKKTSETKLMPTPTTFWNCGIVRDLRANARDIILKGLFFLLCGMSIVAHTSPVQEEWNLTPWSQRQARTQAHSLMHEVALGMTYTETVRTVQKLHWPPERLELNLNPKGSGTIVASTPKEPLHGNWIVTLQFTHNTLTSIRLATLSKRFSSDAPKCCRKMQNEP